jgi:hypothetical protein
LRFIHIRSAGANPVERRLAVSGLNEIGEGRLLSRCLSLTEDRSNGSGHTENGENQTLHVVSPEHWRSQIRHFCISDVN